MGIPFFAFGNRHGSGSRGGLSLSPIDTDFDKKLAHPRYTDRIAFSCARPCSLTSLDIHEAPIASAGD